MNKWELLMENMPAVVTAVFNQYAKGEVSQEVLQRVCEEYAPGIIAGIIATNEVKLP